MACRYPFSSRPHFVLRTAGLATQHTHISHNPSRAEKRTQRKSSLNSARSGVLRRSWYCRNAGVSGACSELSMTARKIRWRSTTGAFFERFKHSVTGFPPLPPRSPAWRTRDGLLSHLCAHAQDGTNQRKRDVRAGKGHGGRVTLPQPLPSSPPSSRESSSAVRENSSWANFTTYGGR